VTASFGVATQTLDMKERDALTAKADAALYYSKTNGRNQVTHARDMLDQLSVCLPDAGI
jgi:PleD family two-component response regulator